MSSLHPDIKAVLDGDSEGCIIHGDCLEIMADMPDGCVDSVVTDPPYGMAFVSNRRAVKSGAIVGDGTLDLLKWACGTNVSHSRYVFCRWGNLRDVSQPKSAITWIKNNWSMGDLEHEHARQSELVLFWPGPDHYWPDGRPRDVVFADRTGNIHHPSEKPVELMEQVVAWTDGIVWDFFCGSGTTCVAAKKLGRRYIGIEIDEKYCQTACNRLRDTPRPLFTEPVEKKPDALLFQEQAQ